MYQMMQQITPLPTRTYTEIHGRVPLRGSLDSPGIVAAVLEQMGRRGIWFDCYRTDKDLHEERSLRRRYPSFATPTDAYFTDVADFLFDHDISDASVDFVRLPSGLILRGSGRVPLRVQAPGLDAVVKKYDNYDSGRERKILSCVQGVIAPKVHIFGESLYLEDYIGRSHTSLLSRSQDLDNRSPEMNALVMHAARIHGILARLGIHYAHNHFMDEFRMNEQGKYLVTDFGTSYFFRDEDFFDERTVQAAGDAYSAAMESLPHRSSPNFTHAIANAKELGEVHTAHRVLFASSSRVRENPSFLEGYGFDADVAQLPFVTLVNIERILYLMDDALHNFLEQRQTSTWESGWTLLEHHMPSIRRAFLETYFAQ